MATTGTRPVKQWKPIEVTISEDKNGNLEVSPDPFHVSKGNQEAVVWTCIIPNAYFTVDFGSDSPFYESQFNNQCSCSGLVRRDVLHDPDKHYKYTVRVKGHPVLDPGGIVDP